jgi:hypothetical protein
MKLRAIILYIALLLAGPLYAQNAEKELNAHLQHIQYWRYEYAAEDTSFPGEVNQEDSVRNANKQLLEYLLNEGKRKAELLKADIKLPENSDLKYVTSEDKKLRIYCWDIQAGTSTHYYNAVAIYDVGGALKMAIINEVPAAIAASTPTGYIYTSVETIIGNNGAKHYLPFFTSQSVEKGVTKGVAAYTISNDLKEATLFNSSASIIYAYDHASNYDFKKMKERYVIHLERNKLYVPEVEGMNVTGKWIVYVWNGEQFNKDKSE